MAKVLSSISGNLISAASAGYAPTNSADVSAIASAYQVVSATATQLYAGTAFLTGVNGAPVSASRAGQAANASMATSAYYDGTGRLISALPDSAAVSSIASSYAESAASSKADASSLSSYALSSDVSGVIDTVSSNSASWSGGSLPISGSAGDESGIYDASSIMFTRYDTAGEPDIRTAMLTPDSLWMDYTLDGDEHTSMTLNESMLTFTIPGGDRWVDAYSIDTWNSAVDTVANNSASWGQSGIDSATVSAIASSYAESAVSSKLDTTAQVVSATAGDGTYVTSINGMGISGQGGGATGDYVEKSAEGVAIGSDNTAQMDAFAQGYGNKATTVSFAQGEHNSARDYSFAQGQYNTPYYNSFAQGQYNSAYSISFAQGSFNTAKSISFAQGDTISAINTAAVFGKNNLRGDGDTSTGDSAAFAIGDGTSWTARHDLMLVTKDGEITMYSSTADTTGTGIMSSIRAISAAATGGGVDSATVSSIASSYAESAASGKLDTSAFNSGDFYSTANPSGFITGVDLTPYQPTSAMSSYATTAYVESGLSGKENVFSAGTGLEFVQSGSDRVLQVEAPVDIVAGPGIVIDNPDGNTLRVSNIGFLISETDAVRCGTFKNDPMFMKTYTFTGTVGTSETTINMTIDEKKGTGGVNRIWIDPSNSFVLYGSAGNNFLPISWRLASGRQGSVGVLGANNGTLSCRCVDTSSTPLTFNITIRFTVSNS